MKIVQNKVDDYLTANFTEDETAWLAGSLFNFGDEIRDGHYIYKYASQTPNSNTTDAPSVNSTSTFPSWVNIRPTNYFAMLDGKTSSSTVNPTSITVDLACNNYDSIALLELTASAVNISLYDNVSMQVVYTKDFEIIDTTEIIDFYTYCFLPIEARESFFTDDIPLYSNAVLTVTITADNASCGRLVFGRSDFIGNTQYEASLSQESYSRRTTDLFGNVNTTPIGSVNYDSYKVQVATSAIPSLRKRIRALDAVDVLFVPDESITSKTENLLNYGYLDKFSILLPNPVKSMASVTIKGIL